MDTVAIPVELTEIQALTRAVSNTLTQQWAGTSGDKNPLSVAMQMAARVEFRLGKASMSHIPARVMKEANDILVGSKRFRHFRYGEAQGVPENIPGFESIMRKYLRAQYDNTQAAFADQGITHVTVYRGAGIADLPLTTGGVNQTMGFAPMSSFSSSYSEAFSFADGAGHGRQVVMAIRVPVRYVIGSARSGYGCLNELEYVILGGDHEVAWLSIRAPSATQIGVTKSRTLAEAVMELLGLPDIEAANAVLLAGGG